MEDEPVGIDPIIMDRCCFWFVESWPRTHLVGWIDSSFPHRDCTQPEKSPTVDSLVWSRWSVYVDRHPHPPPRHGSGTSHRYLFWDSLLRNNGSRCRASRSLEGAHSNQKRALLINPIKDIPRFPSFSLKTWTSLGHKGFDPFPGILSGHQFFDGGGFSCLGTVLRN